MIKNRDTITALIPTQGAGEVKEEHGGNGLRGVSRATVLAIYSMGGALLMTAIDEGGLLLLLVSPLPIMCVVVFFYPFSP